MPELIESPDRPARPSLEQWFHDTVSGRNQGLGATLARGALAVAAAGYGLGLRAREATYALGLVKPVRVDARVISVGNLTLGGTGKTPAVAYLARQLRDRGERVAVLIRGHGGEKLTGVNVVHDGARRRLDWETVGDEAVLLAERLQDVPVLAGKDRRLTAAAAVDRFGATALVLDDAFQYRRLHIDQHVVLLDATRPFGNGKLFPAGELRDPPRYLARADEIWLTRTDHPDAVDLDDLERVARRRAPDKPVRRTVHQPARLTTFPGRHNLPLDELSGKRVAAMAGIGNPGAFAATVAGLGVAECRLEAFPDHHPFTPQDLTVVSQRAAEAGLDAVVTTEKDAVRLELWPAGGPPLWVLGIALGFEDDPPTW